MRARRSRSPNELDDDALRVDALVMLAFLGGAVGDRGRAGTRSAGARARARDRRAVKLSTRRSTLFESGDVDSRAGAASSAEHRRVARARRASQRQGTLFSLALARALGRPLAARGGVRRACIRAQGAVRARGALGPSADRRDRRSSRSARARTRALGARACGSARSSSGSHTPVHLGTLGVVALQDGDPHGAARGLQRPRRSPRGSAGASRATAGGPPTMSRRCSARPLRRGAYESSTLGRRMRGGRPHAQCSRT